jgi:hypothetical protein
MQSVHRRVPHSSDEASKTTKEAKPLLRRRKNVHKPKHSGYQVLLKTILKVTAALALICTLLLVSWKYWTVLAGAPIQLASALKPTGYGNNGGVISDLSVLPWNPIYRIPEAMTVVGDRSGHYARLRKDTDAYFSLPGHLQGHLEEIEAAQRSVLPRPMEMHNSDQVAYDIYDCPETPPAGYPYSWKTLDILKAWPADETTPPQADGKNETILIHQSLCVFDYVKDYDKALRYRDAALPFVTVNDPSVLKTAARWSLPNYMDLLMGTVPHRAEYSQNNHFMYYVPPPKHRGMRGGGGDRSDRHRGGDGLHGGRGPHLKIPDGWTEPTKNLRMTYQEWFSHANVSQTTRDDPHWYFRLIGCGAMGNDGTCDFGSSEYLFDELPFFQPRQPSMYVVDAEEQKGIHCRFGMQGVIAENHFDGSRNAIALLSGSRRYILSHPSQCSNLALYPKGHPSARHSAVDWSNPDLEQFPEFQEAQSSEVVMQAGQVLYLPTNWFHFIVSLEINFQCNTRSGLEDQMMSYIHACGF